MIATSAMSTNLTFAALQNEMQPTTELCREAMVQCKPQGEEFIGSVQAGPRPRQLQRQGWAGREALRLWAGVQGQEQAQEGLRREMVRRGAAA